METTGQSSENIARRAAKRPALQIVMGDGRTRLRNISQEIVQSEYSTPAEISSCEGIHWLTDIERLAERRGQSRRHRPQRVEPLDIPGQ